MKTKVIVEAIGLLLAGLFWYVVITHIISLGG